MNKAEETRPSELARTAKMVCVVHPPPSSTPRPKQTRG